MSTVRLWGPLVLLVLAATAAMPWWSCRILGWDQDLSVISGNLVTEQTAVHAICSLVAWGLAGLVSPSLAVAAGWRAVLELVPMGTPAVASSPGKGMQRGAMN